MKTSALIGPQKGESIHISTKDRLISIVSSVALVACFAYTSVSAPLPHYNLTEIGVLPGKKVSTAAAINNQGQVAGTSAAGPSSDSAFRYDSVNNGSLEDLGKNLPGSISRAFALNESGLVAGDSTFGEGNAFRHAALFSNGSAADLGVLKSGGDFSRANGINALGHVVGFSGPKLDGDVSRAFIWSAATGMIDIGTLGGKYAQALAINDRGFVTGHSETAGRVAGEVHAFIYQPISFTESPTRQMRDLGTLGGRFSYGTFINDSNHVVGYSAINTPDNRVHAFLHDGEKMHDLGSLGGKSPETDHSVALGINTAGQVVGYSYLPYDNMTDRPSGPIHRPQQVAFLHHKGVMVDLNKLIGTAAQKYLLYSATAINDRGQIAVDAFDRSNNVVRAVLLTPISTGLIP